MPPGWVGGVVDTNLAGPWIDRAARGKSPRWFSTAGGGSRCLVARVSKGDALVGLLASGYKNTRSAGWCWPAAQPCQDPSGPSAQGPFTGLQELKSSTAWGLPRG